MESKAMPYMHWRVMKDFLASDQHNAFEVADLPGGMPQTSLLRLILGDSLKFSEHDSISAGVCKLLFHRRLEAFKVCLRFEGAFEPS